MRKRLLSIFLTLCLTLTLLPVAAFAAEEVSASEKGFNTLVNYIWTNGISNGIGGRKIGATYKDEDSETKIGIADVHGRKDTLTFTYFCKKNQIESLVGFDYHIGNPKVGISVHLNYNNQIFISFTLKDEVDISTYTPSTTLDFELTLNDPFHPVEMSEEEVQTYCNTFLKLAMTSLEVFLLEEANMRLSDIGFTSFYLSEEEPSPEVPGDSDDETAYSLPYMQRFLDTYENSCFVSTITPEPDHKELTVDVYDIGEYALNCVAKENFTSVSEAFSVVWERAMKTIRSVFKEAGFDEIVAMNEYNEPNYVYTKQRAGEEYMDRFMVLSKQESYAMMNESNLIYILHIIIPNKQPSNPSYFTITFDANRGSVSTSSAQTNADGKLFNLPTPVRSGYTFDGWYTDQTGGDKITEATVFNMDTTVYAHWSEPMASTPELPEESVSVNASADAVAVTVTLPMDEIPETTSVKHVLCAFGNDISSGPALEYKGSEVISGQVSVESTGKGYREVKIFTLDDQWRPVCKPRIVQIQTSN